MSQLSVKVSERTSNGETFYQGTVSGLQNAGSFKVTKADGNSQFSSAAGVKAAAQRLADKIGYSVDFGEKATTKKAAKKTAKTKSSTGSTGTPTSSNPCSGW